MWSRDNQLYQFWGENPPIQYLTRNGVSQPVCSGVPLPETVVPMTGLVLVVFTRGGTVSAVSLTLEHGS